MLRGDNGKVATGCNYGIYEEHAKNDFNAFIMLSGLVRELGV